MVRAYILAVAATAALSLGATAAKAQASPLFNYLQNCAACHQVDGTGLPPEVPNLRSDLGYLLESPEGRDFILRVPGVTGVPITANEVADLLNWIIATFYPDRADFEPFTDEEVSAGRANPLYDPIGYRSKLFPEH